MPGKKRRGAGRAQQNRSLQSRGALRFPARRSKGALMEEYRKTGLSDKTISTLRRSIAGFANLYGTISVRDAYRILRDGMHSPPSPEQFRAFIKVARHDGPFLIMREGELFSDTAGTEAGRQVWILHGSFRHNSDPARYAFLREEQKGKPLYEAPLERVLQYANGKYIEPTPAAENLLAALREQMGDRMTEDKLREMMADAVLRSQQISGPQTMSLVLSVFESRGLSLVGDVDTLNDFLQMIMAFLNSTPRWANRGYTPSQLSAVLYPDGLDPSRVRFSVGPTMRDRLADNPEELEEYRQAVLTSDMPEGPRRSLLAELDDIDGNY